MKCPLSHARFLTLGAYPLKFVRLLESQYHIPSEKVLYGINLTREALNNPKLMLPFSDCVAIFRNGIAQCPDRDIGLRFATHLRPSSHGLLGTATLTAKTLQDVVNLFYDYAGLVAPFLLLHQEARHHCCVLAFEVISDVAISEMFTFEIIHLASFNILKMILGERSRELAFHFAYPAPPHQAAYRLFFDCDLYFNATFNGVSIPSILMCTPLPTADVDTHRLLMNQIVDSMTLVQVQSSLVGEVRNHLRQMQGPLPRMSQVAGAFNMSTRTFRNHLRRYNLSYQMLLDEERRGLAVHFLRDTEKSIKEISYELGFQESSNFSRVFKRWTGVTPLNFRREPSVRS